MLFFLLLVGFSETAISHHTASDSMLQSESPGTMAPDSSVSVFSLRYAYDWVAER